MRARGGRKRRRSANAEEGNVYEKGKEKEERVGRSVRRKIVVSEVDVKLCGYVLVVLAARLPEEESKNEILEINLGSNCWLEEQGGEMCMGVENSDLLLVSKAPREVKVCVDEILKAGVSTPDRTSAESCVTSEMADSPMEALDIGNSAEESESGIIADRATSGNSNSTREKSRFPDWRASNILNQLHVLEKKNSAKVDGKVVYIEPRGDRALFVVLVDVYLPISIWTSSRNFWKTGALVAAGLSHLSCDWDRRTQILHSIDASWCRKDSPWHVGECHVLGCKLHHRLVEKTKNTRFDLHSLFKILPSCDRSGTPLNTSLKPLSCVGPSDCGLWSMPDDVLTSVLGRLLPKDLHSVAAVCRHMRTLAASVMPCLNLKLYEHQQSAVSWMLQRELNPQTLSHPYVREMQTADGYPLYLHCVTGELSPEMPPPVTDFRGGLFCDEPGLGKTVTALSLILKTQGTLSQPPPGVSVRWCEHTSDQKYGYYEISSRAASFRVMSALKRCSVLKARRYQFDSSDLCYGSPITNRKAMRGSNPAVDLCSPSFNAEGSSNRRRASAFETLGSRRDSAQVKRKLWEAFGDVQDERVEDVVTVPQAPSPGVASIPTGQGGNSKVGSLSRGGSSRKSTKFELEELAEAVEQSDNETWAQCDACSKWRRIPDEGTPLKEGLAWFCSMNKDVLHQDCTVPEETFDANETIKSLPGFARSDKGTEPEVNVPFFRNVLKEHAHLLDVEAKRAVNWLADLSPDALASVSRERGLQMPPALRMTSVSGHDNHQYDKLFKAFGLVKKEAKKCTTWLYPRNLDNLSFDSKALRVALSDPVDDLTRFYLSKATLIVVPPNLIEHWRSQILKHTAPGQLRYFIWSDVKKPPAAHILAWDYDIVITTFSRLSSEWSNRETSPLVRIHWLRIMLDEGHTLGVSLSMTNKLQMAISMQASRRWLLTGTPTPNTPSSQVAQLHPMLKFLHEEFYGKHPRAWEGAILRPFEGGREEGRERLLELLQRCMISARKSDLHSIPPCIRKVKLLDFTTEQHAASYNELVETVKRNILMADWKDPSHVESLLNPKQWKFRSTTLRNVRLSCCVAGHIKVRNAGEDIQETMDMFVEQGMDPCSEDLLGIKSSLIHGGICQRCSEWCRLPIVTPCAHLLCLSCVSLDCEKCTILGCGNPYKMQDSADRARPENPNPKWPVPQDLIELQPSYVQDNWHSDWQNTSSSKVAYLVKQLKEMDARNKKMMQSHSIDVVGVHDFHSQDRETSNDPVMGKQDASVQNLPEKAIVFSQFLEHINVVEKQVAAAGIHIVGMYSPMQYSNKMKSLVTFQKEPECTVLVMDGSVALGLDLSFVTHVYLMEPIWDRSMEEQVISRAHRMGAMRPVLVETLAMSGTIEEQMLRFMKDPMAFSGESDKLVQDAGECSRHRSMHDPAESSYLAQLEFVRAKVNR